MPNISFVIYTLFSFLGNVVNAVHHARVINREIKTAAALDDSELFSYAKQLQVPVDLLRQTAKLGRLPVVNFAAGGMGNINSYCTCYNNLTLYIVIRR